MVVARQNPADAAARSRHASYMAAQASQSAYYSSNGEDEGPPHAENDDDGQTSPTQSALSIDPTTTITSTGSVATTFTSEFKVMAIQGTDTTSASFTSLSPESTPAQWMNPSMTWSVSPPGWHSPAATSGNAAGSSSTDAASLNPNLESQRKSHDGPSAAVIAGVVVPIVLILMGGLVFLSCIRKRRRQRAAVVNPGPASGAEATGMIEKVASKKVTSDLPPPTLMTTTLSPIDEAMATPQRPQLVITSPQNPTYFSGLDTFSVHSATTTEDPPPPYRARSVLSHRSSEQHTRAGATSSIPLSPISPISPASPTSHLASPFSDANAVNVVRSPSQRSFASTLYSSNASVYEARPARLSTGPAECLVSNRLSGDEQSRVRSPFEDPEDESDDGRVVR